MRSCTQCGSQASEYAQFCKECGAPLKQADGGEIARAEHIADNSNTNRTFESEYEFVSLTGSSSLPRAQAESAATATHVTTASLHQVGSTTVAVRMSGKQKVLILLVALLLAALFGGYKAGEYFMSTDRLIGRLEKALDSKDSKAVAVLLSSKDERLVINEKSIAGFMNYLDQNPVKKEEILDTLKEQAAVKEHADTERNDEKLLQGYGLNGIINLENSGKTLWYDKYKLTMSAVYIRVETNYAGTVLSVNGQQAAVADTPEFETELGPFVPGLYQVEARFKNEFVSLTHAEEVQLLDPEKSYRTYLELEGEVVTWDTYLFDQADLKGRLFINGKKVEVNPFENPEFGPVTMDGSMTLAVEADFPWGTVRSAEVKILERNIDLDFTHQENFKTSIKDTIVKHAKENLDAFASGDADKLTVSTHRYKDVLQNIIDQFKESGYTYKSNYLGTVFDTGSFDLNLRDGVWQMTLITQPLIEAATFVQGEPVALAVQEAYSETGLLYDEAQGIWRVDYIMNTWGFRTKELEEVKEQKPVTFESTWDEAAELDSPDDRDLKLPEASGDI